MTESEEPRDAQEAPPAEPASDLAAVYLERIRISGFRGINECDLILEPDLTVLVGRNNAGKSRILRALALATGAVPADRDDLTVPGMASATIDVILAPIVADGAVDEFEARIARRLESVTTISEDPVHERFAWRTTIRPSKEGLGVRADHGVLVWDETSQDWVLPSSAATPSFEQRSIVAADLVETRRDLVEEFAKRGSPIRRILDDLEIDPEERAALEANLQNLGDEIVASSGSMEAIRGALDRLAQSVDSVGTASIRPLPVRLEELARSVSVELDAGDGELPIRFHGAGARSLTSLQVQSVLYERRLGKDGPALRPHPVSLVEEPEAHLHPQAQFELCALLSRIPGQVVVSTHSSHLVSVAEPRCLRVVRPGAGSTSIIDLRPAESDESADVRARRPSMHLEEMEKIRRLVERPFGELLFASAVVLGDGATERALLPPLMREALGSRAHGLCVVDPGSMASEFATAIVKFCALLGVPWLLFSDSDEQGVLAATRLVDQHAAGDVGHIVWVPAAPAPDLAGAATEKMMIEFDSDLCIAACQPLGFEGSEEDLLQYMKKHKGAIGSVLAIELLERHPWAADDPACWPSALCELAGKLGDLLPKGST